MSGKVELELINDGTLNVADLLYENLYGVTNDSLENINGQLTSENLTENIAIKYQNVQRNSFSGGGQVGGTANLDFFGGGSGSPLGSGWFRGANTANADRYLSIPGASLKFSLPYEAHVLLFWTITWVNDNNEGAKDSRIALFLNDSETIGIDTRTMTNTPFARRVRRTMYGGADADAGGSTPGVTVLSTNQLQDRYKSRTWSGHCWVPATLSAGFHDVSLRVCADASIKQTRVRARSMKYVYFKNGATL
tara:strand:- start:8536 stop:9285 length:750 start_codon:yes stop_codon:yes gene_type:complete